MARGSIAKEALTQKILECFEGSFIYGKEIRVPFVENGETVQIKITLTCAKENVEAETGAAVESTSAFPAPSTNPVATVSAPDNAEKARVAQFLESLGL